jgi:hypothetical protein
MATTDESKRRVRRTAIGAALLMTAGVGVVIAGNPYPAAQHPASPELAALTAREKALVQRAHAVSARSAQQWHTYRVQLAARQTQITAATLANASGGATSPSAAYVPAAPVASTRTS